jgi:hypothetical protein
MAKYINAMQVILERQKFAGMDAAHEFDTYMRQIPISIEYITIGGREEPYKDAAMDLAATFSDIDAVVICNNRPQGYGGRIYSLLEFYNQAQPMIRFVGLTIAGQGIASLAHKGWSTFKNLFKKTIRPASKNPLYIRIEGENNANLQFRFFSYFNETDLEHALKAIPDALREYTLTENAGQLLFFDRKENKWFKVGYEAYYSD